MREAVQLRNAAIIAAEAKRLSVSPELLNVVMGCDFCGRDQHEVEILIAGEAIQPEIDVHICEDCVATCVELIADKEARAILSETGTPSPSSVGMSEANELKALLDDNARLREALTEAESVLQLVEHNRCEDPQYQAEVTALGQRIGFGALMSAAQYGWRETLRQRGDPLGGEFVSGPCKATVDATLKIVRQALSHHTERKGT